VPLKPPGPNLRPKTAEGRSHVYKVTVHHDPGCPCLTGQPLSACTCKTVDLTGRKVA
jgi:hypothetical protein